MTQQHNDPLAALVAPAKPKKAAKADATPVIELSPAQLAAAVRVANAIESKKACEAEHVRARAELETDLERLRVELSRKQGRYLTTVKVSLGNGRWLKYTKKQQGSGPSGASQAAQVAAIRQQLGITEAERFLRSEVVYQVRSETLANGELMARIVERLGPELVGALLERVETVSLAPDFWTEQTLNESFSDRAQQLATAGLIKARSGEFALAK